MNHVSVDLVDRRPVMTGELLPPGAMRFDGKVVLVFGGGSDSDGVPSNGSAAAVAYARE